MIKLLLYLYRTCKREVVMVAGLGLLGGSSSALIIALVNAALHNQGNSGLLPAGFAVAAVLKIAAGLLSSILLLRMSHTAVLRLCDELCRRVLASPLRRIEEVGTPRVLAALTDDVNTLSTAIQEVPHLIVNSAIMVGCGLYLAWISIQAALCMLCIAIVGGVCYRMLLGRAQKAFELARDERDALFRHFRSLTDGIKELKSNRWRREAFFSQDLNPTILNLRKYGVIAVRQHIVASGWSQSVFFGLLGILIFILPGAGIITTQGLSAYVFVALFTSAPLWAIIAALPSLNRGQTALARIAKIGDMLDESLQAVDGSAELSNPAPQLEFEQVEFSYKASEGAGGFALGPLTLTLNPGELVFVTGGNGSGKSTFVKLLTGLYAPVSGEIRVNGEPISPANRESYSELFSVVYSDFFLFDQLPDGNGEEMERKAHEYLQMLKLDQKVQIINNKLSTTSLSQGQRRRLALLMAYLENRPIYVLDEWAADQDPKYREVFYTQLLPELKRKGKAVVVVTHDDRYYYLGDRIVNLDYGKIRNAPADHRVTSFRPADVTAVIGL